MRSVKHVGRLGIVAIMLVMMGVMAPAVLVYGQTPDSAAQSDRVNRSAPPSVRFEADASEPMKYRYLWIAYSIVWLLVFGLMWTTWRRQSVTARELVDLRKRLAALEERDGNE